MGEGIQSSSIGTTPWQALKNKCGCDQLPKLGRTILTRRAGREGRTARLPESGPRPGVRQHAALGSSPPEGNIAALRSHLGLWQHRLVRPVATNVFDDVAAIVREVSAEVIEPRWGALGQDEMSSKSPGEVVTVADEEAEALLTARLKALWPPAAVVGEEACSARPELMEVLASERAWLVDPLDGTANFVDGSPDWAVMVALVENGTTLACWIWQPVTQLMYIAEFRNGAVRNGEPLPGEGSSRRPSEMRGAVLTRFLDQGTAALIAGNTHRFAAIRPGRACAGCEYPAVAEGEEDFALFWRTLPWDHAPGVLLVSETGAPPCA